MSGTRSGPIGARRRVDEKLRATLGFIEKQTLRPDELTEADAEAVYAAGVSKEAPARRRDGGAACST